MDGIINIIKPPGMSSFQVVSHIRKLLGVKKVGHIGTLDPGAAGVLPLCIGKATRIIPFLEEETKTYLTEVTLGIATKSQDASGETDNLVTDFAVTPDQFGTTLSTFLGEIEQIPPMASAVRVNGKRLYELDRQGITVERKPRKVKIHEIHVNKIWSEDSLLTFGTRVLLSIKCSKGTYIRTICHDLGEALGTAAHMSFLVRTENGPFSIENGVTIEEVENSLAQKNLDFLLGIEKGLPNYPKVRVSPLVETKILNGNFITATDLLDVPQKLVVGDQVLLFSLDDDLLAIGEIQMKDQLICQPIRVLKEGN